MLGFRTSGIVGAQDDDAIRRSADVTQDQRQDTLSDAAETHKYDPAAEIHMHFVFAHDFFPNLVFLCVMKKCRGAPGPDETSGILRPVPWVRANEAGRSARTPGEIRCGGASAPVRGNFAPWVESARRVPPRRRDPTH